ncbi:MAG: iron-containing alcohol dehydrogenase [Roseofilum sp. SBFL]|uniref:iron-containing alcohol dehydrogenase n=1 Tax=unclassified Roseofilum TaxID=2620099 RepID=UPI001B2191F0|nr:MULTISPECIES: iron-containing alcohol dehydrogenase [unclassified Roseofilum]MBP0015816.1 iron-containing alcohol dehydrogenase [Roseofilum sp. SID3]MBP0022728.1 iron-containing alcohol dehydrogenase [Roseofilum sp. SID2]MBP0037027.1 iron-containing alcohol dehydrogenase [Roseofilum sp. SID1]MBP0041979.1 iron-containing alcohol dehydrogenase [Roseofilum sp. SBFL]
MKAFSFSKVPPIYFGAGQVRELSSLITQFQGNRVLLITGANSLQASGKLDEIKTNLSQSAGEVYHTICDREPTDSLIDGICAEIRDLSIDTIVSIGGGSVIDVGKAIACGIPPESSAIDHIQTLIANRYLTHPKIPLIAIPTTSGSGNEVTPKIAIDRVGIRGTKTFFTHPQFIPDAVILDPELSISCPSDLTATCGLVTLSHLIEAEFALHTSALTEAIIWSGLESLKDNLLLACAVGASSQAVRGKMAYASCASGISQANSSIGLLQSLSITLSSFCPIPYRIACSTLAGSALRVSLKALRTRYAQNPILVKLAKVGELFDGRTQQSPNYYCDALVNIIEAWVQILPIPRLGQYGISAQDLPPVVEKTLDYCPDLDLHRNEIYSILQDRL